MQWLLLPICVPAAILLVLRKQNGEGISYGDSFRVALYCPNIPIPHVEPDLEGLWACSFPAIRLFKKKNT